MVNLSNFDNMYRAYSICTFVLTIKYFFAIIRNVSPNRVKEDYKEGEEPNANVQLTEEQLRRSRIAANGIENEPMDLAFFLMALISTSFNSFQQKSDITALVLTIMICLYTFARTIFWICYAKGWSLARRLFFLTGKLCSIGALIIFIVTSFEFNIKQIMYS